MNSVFFDPVITDDERREQLYAGQLFVYSAPPGSQKLVELARQMIEEAFGNRNPELAQHDMPVEEYAALLTDLKPRFIHHPRSKECIQEILREMGCDPENTYFDVPRMRTSTSENYLTSGIAYAFHPHRDTWYSAPMCQINWWLPIFPVREDNAMGFDPNGFARAVPNTSDGFDYYENNASRLTTASQVTKERQSRPGAIDHNPEQQLVILPAPGEVLLFSGAQLHTSTPNTSGRARYSVDFRTVFVPDLVAGRGAPLVDVNCTGTAIRDFVNVADESSFDEEFVVELFGAPPADAMLVFESPDQK